MWRLVAEGPYQDVEYEDVRELPHGTKVQFEIETLPGLAYAANIWGDEWVLNKFASEDVMIIRTEAVSSSRVLCQAVVNSPGLSIIVGLLLFCIATGLIIYLVKTIKVWVDEGSIPDLPEIFTSRNIALAVAGGLAVVAIGVTARELLRT